MYNKAPHFRVVFYASLLFPIFNLYISIYLFFKDRSNPQLFKNRQGMYKLLRNHEEISTCHIKESIKPAVSHHSRLEFIDQPDCENLENVTYENV